MGGEAFCMAGGGDAYIGWNSGEVADRVGFTG
jgi:hypothetical protein